MFKGCANRSENVRIMSQRPIKSSSQESLDIYERMHAVFNIMPATDALFKQPPLFLARNFRLALIKQNLQGLAAELSGLYPIAMEYIEQ